MLQLGIKANFLDYYDNSPLECVVLYARGVCHMLYGMLVICCIFNCFTFVKTPQHELIHNLADRYVFLCELPLTCFVLHRLSVFETVRVSSMWQLIISDS